MNVGDAIEKLQKWGPVIDLLKGMFGDPSAALEAVRSWELAKRAENDARLEKLKDRDDG